MSKQSDYESILDIIKAISDDDTIQPSTIPVDIYNQEAENIYQWSIPDKDSLIAKGLDWSKIEEIPVRNNALSYAEAIWFKERFSKEDAQKEWKVKAPQANQLRAQILHDFHYAYRNDIDLSSRVSAVSEGTGYADMIQDLIDLSVLGKANPDPLTAINFDMALLDQAADLSGQLKTLWAIATGDLNDNSETKKIRDKAYTYLKVLVDELKLCGQYVFWNNAERYRGYVSPYLKEKRAKNLEKKKLAAKKETTTTTQPEVKTT